MKKGIFLAHCLILATAFTQVYLYGRYKFSGVEQLRVRVGQLERDVDKERFRAMLAGHELAEYRSHVATLLPEAIERSKGHEEKYRLRTLASVVQAQDSDQLPLERASGLFEKGKTQFRDGSYEEAVGAFRELIERFPESIHIAEAHFLLAEAQFQMKEYEPCLATIESMITLFPESELTGFALLRLGKIYEYQDRLEDAVEVYRTILKSYGDQPLLTQARLSLKAVEL
ncbi:MAG: tetratricopeptide repeat protein [Bdellovibrionaceae bacterium]|nr:tetratricopeptide repeat protein [Pseudobdellovibrionaceae bacterium]